MYSTKQCIGVYALLCAIAAIITPNQANHLMHSGVRTVGGSSAVEAIRRVIETTINVPAPHNWGSFANNVVANGNADAREVTLNNYEEFINSWGIPESIKNKVRDVSRILVLSADASYKADHIQIQLSQGSVATVVVCVKQIDPNDGRMSMAYLMVEATCNILPQVSVVPYEHCRRCAKKLWVGRCCETRYNHIQRGLTQDEVNVVINRLRHEQFNHAMMLLQRFPVMAFRSRPQITSKSLKNSEDMMYKAMIKYTRDLDIQDEIMTHDNSSLIKDLQNVIKTLENSYQTLNLKKVALSNLKRIIMYLNTKFAMNLNASDAEKFEKNFIDDNSIVEILHSHKRTITYTMIISTRNGNFCDIVATHTKTLIETAPTLNLTITSTINETDFGADEIIQSVGDKSVQTKEIRTVVQTFRWFGLKKLLSAFSAILDPIFMPLAFETMVPSVISAEIPQTPALAAMAALGTAMEAVAKGWQSIANAFKSKTTVTLERVVRLGFEHFQLDSQVLVLKGFPIDKLDLLADYIFKRFNIPESMQFERDDMIIFGLAEDGSVWDQRSTLFSKDSSGKCNHLQILKNPNTEMTKSNWVITGFKTDFNIAPDILVKRTSKSKLGGLFESDKTEFLSIPHAVTPEEVVQILNFIEIVAYGSAASKLGVQVTYPKV